MTAGQTGGRAVEFGTSPRPEPTPSFPVVCIPFPVLATVLTFRTVVQDGLSNFRELPLVVF